MSDIAQLSDSDLQRLASASQLQGMSDEDLKRLSMASGVKMQNDNGASWGAVDNTANSMLFNFGDEIKAAANAAKESMTGGLPYGKAYDQALSMYRGAAKNYEEENPKAALATTALGAVIPIAAGVAPPLMAGGAIAPAAVGAAPGIGKMMAQSAGLGAGFGAANGFGAGEGGVVNRLQDAGVGGLFGAGTGAILPPAAAVAGWAYGKTAGPIVSKVGDYLQSKIPTVADTFPARKMAEAFTRDGIDPATVEQLMRDRGPGTMMYDVGKENVLGLTRGAANLPGPQMQTAQEVTAARRLARGEKLVDAASDGLGGGDFYSSLRAWDAAKKADSAPLYDKAFGNAIPISEDVSAFVNDPAFKSGIMKGIRQQQLEALPGKPPSMKDYGITGFKTETDPFTGAQVQTPIIEGQPNMRLLDAAKRGVDETLDKMRDPTTGMLPKTSEVRALNGARARYVQTLDQLNPDYAAARNAYAGPSQLMDAAQLGRRFATRDPEVTTQILSNMTDSEKEAFRVGSLQGLKGTINSDTARAPAKFEATKVNFMDRLKATFPDDASFQQFKEQADKVLDEMRRDALVSPRANSQTARVTAQFGEMKQDPSAASGVLGPILAHPTNPASYFKAIGGGYRALQDWNARPLSSIAPQIGQMAFSSDPSAARAMAAKQQSLLDAFRRAGVGVDGLPFGGLLSAVGGAESGGSRKDRY